MDQCLELNITPLAYSPIGGGWLSGKREIPADHPRRETIERTLTALRELSAEYEGATPTQLSIAWLLAHPAKIIPLVGSNNPEHIREMAAAAKFQLSRTDWYKLWVAARGERVPRSDRSAGQGGGRGQCLAKVDAGRAGPVARAVRGERVGTFVS